MKNPDDGKPGKKSKLSAVPVPLERDLFLRTLIRHLAGALQDVVGLEEASGFVSIVGQKMGDEMNAMYKSALQVEKLNPKQIADVCVDLKERIKGDFYVIEQNDEKIIFGNNVCPFAEKVVGRPALCMMTSNVFGSIAADNLGYSKVVIEESIARGHSGCRVVVFLKPTTTSQEFEGREYYKADVE